jgi:murein DD-endopeptidase MepM/ murein hydrolase activator NlpD
MLVKDSRKENDTLEEAKNKVLTMYYTLTQQMRIFIFLLVFSSISMAQNLEVSRDTIASSKDTISFSLKNHMLSPLNIMISPKNKTAKRIVYAKNNLFAPLEKRVDFIKVPRAILETDTSLVALTDYFNFKFGYADPKTVKHNDAYRYLLPYKGKRKLIQANFGGFTHNDIETFHAFDFGTKIGDTIYAAREGKVVIFKENSNKYGKSRKYLFDANYIIIQHDDGTTASYFHLDFNGVLVKKGDIVTQGQAIGISGLTGFTTTPHLHFVVHKATEKDGNISIPIEFEDYVGERFRKGKRYARKEEK